MSPRRKRRSGVGTIYRRADTGVWWVQYTGADGDRVRESSGEVDEAAAREVLRRRVAVSNPAPRAKGRHTLDELPARLKAKYRNKRDPSPARLQRYAVRVGQYLAHAGRFFGDCDLRRIDADSLEAYVEFRRADEAASSTIRGELTMLAYGIRLVLGRRPEVPSIGVSNVRQGFMTPAQIAMLLTHLPEYLRPIVEAGYVTGWRFGELRDLQWPQVDWRRGVIRLEVGTTKSGEGREFPFAVHPRLQELFQERREATKALERATGRICPWVFWRAQGLPIARCYQGWNTACTRAKLAGALFHDMRRSAVRNLIDAGIAQSVAMAITGHRTASMFRRYEIRDASDVRAAVAKLAGFHAAAVPEAPEVRAIGGGHVTVGVTVTPETLGVSQGNDGSGTGARFLPLGVH